MSAAIVGKYQKKIVMESRTEFVYSVAASATRAPPAFRICNIEIRYFRVSIGFSAD